MARNESDVVVGHCARQLTPEERKILENDCTTVGGFKKNKLEMDAKKNWDLFYKRNANRFFKDRHWITREFPEMLQGVSKSLKEERWRLPVVLLEAGCGVGNTVYPLLEENENLFIYASDFSPKAIELMKGHASYNEARCQAFVFDLTQGSLSSHIPGGVDMVSLFFVLSAITPEKMIDALRNLFRALRDGGVLLFRDYGLYDHAQLRFGKGHKVQDNFYVRQDGTRVYYFSEEKFAELALLSGFDVIENTYVQKLTINRKKGMCAPRVFLQARLRKPVKPVTSDIPADQTVIMGTREFYQAGLGKPVKPVMPDAPADQAMMLDKREVDRLRKPIIPVPDTSTDEPVMLDTLKVDQAGLRKPVKLVIPDRPTDESVMMDTLKVDQAGLRKPVKLVIPDGPTDESVMMDTSRS